MKSNGKKFETSKVCKRILTKYMHLPISTRNTNSLVSLTYIRMSPRYYHSNLQFKKKLKKGFTSSFPCNIKYISKTNIHLSIGEEDKKTLNSDKRDKKIDILLNDFHQSPQKPTLSQKPNGVNNKFNPKKILKQSIKAKELKYCALPIKQQKL